MERFHVAYDYAVKPALLYSVASEGFARTPLSPLQLRHLA